MQNRNKAYVQWSSVYILFFGVILVLVFFSSITFIRYEMKNELIQSHKATANLIDSRITKLVTSVDATATTISKNKQLISLLTEDKYDKIFYSRLMQVNSEISDSLSVNEYISDFAVYVRRGNKLIHGASLFPAESFYADYSPADINEFDEWLKLQEKDNLFEMFARKNGGVLYLKSVYSGSNKIGTVIMVINNTSVKNEFADSIIQGTGNVIMKQNDRLVYYLYDDELLNATKNYDGEEAYFVKDGIAMFARKVGALNVVYSIKESNAYRRIVLYICGVAFAALLLFVLGTIVIVRLSKWLYRPIDSLVKRIGNESSSSEYVNDYDYINEFIDFYEKQKSMNNFNLFKYRNLALSQMLSRYIEGSIDGSVKELFKKCDYKYEHNQNWIIVIYVEEINEAVWIDCERDNQMLYYAIENVCAELFNEEFALVTLPVKETFYVGLVSSDREDVLTHKLNEIFDNVVENFIQLGAKIKIHIGDSFSDLEQLRIKYAQITPQIETHNEKDNAEFVKIWEEVSDTSDVKNATKRVNKIVAYVKENYADSSLTMEKIAKEVGLNPRYMLKIFKEETEILLKDFILKVRIDAAKELLQTDITIEMVSVKCGYASAHSFIRAFKRVCGMTPGEWRQLQQNIKSD